MQVVPCKHVGAKKRKTLVCCAFSNIYAKDMVACGDNSDQCSSKDKKASMGIKNNALTFYVVANGLAGPK